MDNQLPRYGNVFDIQRFSVHDGPGIRTIVFFQGCLLRCRWCSNPESQETSPVLIHVAARCVRSEDCIAVCPENALSLAPTGIIVNRALCTACGDCTLVCPSGAMRIAGKLMSAHEVLTQVERDKVFYTHSGGGMTISGGEPLQQPDFAIALLTGAREQGIHTAIETTGFASTAVLQRVLSQTDLILYDIKHHDSERHREWTGQPNEHILSNARYAAALGVPMVIRVPVVPNFNDNKDDLLAIGQIAIDLGLNEVHLLPYHRYGVPKYANLGREYQLSDTKSMDHAQMEQFQRSLFDLGLTVRIGG